MSGLYRKKLKRLSLIKAKLTGYIQAVMKEAVSVLTARSYNKPMQKDTFKQIHTETYTLYEKSLTLNPTHA